MARFDVYETANDTLVVDYQADSLAYFNTRLVIPLMPPELEPKASDRLNPAILINDKRYVLYPQFAASLAVTELGGYVTSLADRDFAIIDAFDMLTTGY